ncbi:hypothetical protein BGX21_011261, partial [Mortierella sp. AD011]
FIDHMPEPFDVSHIPKLSPVEPGYGGTPTYLNPLEYSPLLESLTLRKYLPAELQNIEPPMLDPISWI